MNSSGDSPLGRLTVTENKHAERLLLVRGVTCTRLVQSRAVPLGLGHYCGTGSCERTANPEVWTLEGALLHSHVRPLVS